MTPRTHSLQRHRDKVMIVESSSMRKSQLSWLVSERPAAPNLRIEFAHAMAGNYGEAAGYKATQK